MFSYVFMKLLEGRPRSYDRLMDKTSHGRVRKIKEEVAAEAKGASRVIEIGCGTGELASMIIAEGATVDGFDASPSMINAAQERIKEENLEGKLAVRNMGVDGMDRFEESIYDAVVSTLVFSELSDDERRFALKHSFRALKPGGKIVIADEVKPRGAAKRFIHSAVRAPMLAATYLVSKQSTRPVPDLAGEISGAGFNVEKETRSHGDAFAIVVGRKPGGKES